MTDQYFLQEAIKEAKKAIKKGEWPVGCVIVLNDKIISRAHNLSHKSKSKLDHAETIALKKIDSILRKNPQKAVLYTTWEPCPMCIGACLVYKIKKIVSGGDHDSNGSFMLLKNLPKYYQQEKFKIDTLDLQDKECLNLAINYHPKNNL